MHDISVAQAVADAIMKSLKGKVPKGLDIELEVGKLRFHDPEQVKFWIDEILRKDIGKDLIVKTSISVIEPVIKCECGYEGDAGDPTADSDLSHHGIYDIICPKCGSPETTIKNGNECQLRKVALS